MKNPFFCSLLFFFLVQLGLLSQPVSEYDPSTFSELTLEVADSLGKVSPWYGIKITNGLSGTPANQFLYWKSKRSQITDNELMMLKNHTSPVVRYYAYSEILGRNIPASNYKFVQAHIQDVEQVRLQEGCVMQYAPLIHYFVEAHPNEVIYWQLLENFKADPQEKNLAYILKYFDYNKEDYNHIKSLAQDGNLAAFMVLIAYKKAEDEVLVINQLKSYVTNKETQNWTKNIFYHINQHGFPSAALDVLVDYHESSIRNNSLSSTLKNYKDLYICLVKYKHPKRLEILEEVLDITKQPSRVQSIAYHDHTDTIIDLRIRLWEEYELGCPDIFGKMKKNYPDKIFELAKRDLDKMLEGNSRLYDGCITRYINLLKERNLSVVTYIDYAVNYQKLAVHQKPRMMNLSEELLPSWKEQLLAMLEFCSSPHISRNTIGLLSRYDLEEAELALIREWHSRIGHQIVYYKEENKLEVQKALEAIGI